MLAAQPAQPEKIHSPEEATALLKELVGDLAKADEDKLDFEPAKVAYEKMVWIKPVASKLDEKTAPEFYRSMGAVSLLAGEPASAVEAYKALFDCKHVHLEGDGFIRRAFFAATLAGDETSAKQMLGKLDFGAAKELSRNAESLGKKLPAFTLSLADGKTFRSTGNEDRVVVFCTWALLKDDAHKQLLALYKAIGDKYEKYPAVTLIGIDMDVADNRLKASAALADSKLRWLPVFEGKGTETPMLKELGLANTIGVMILAPDHRILYKGGAADSPTVWAINAGLRQIEKRHAKPKTDPARAAPPTSRPAGPAASPTTPPTVTTRPAAPAATLDKAQEMLSLAETYRSAGLKDKANQLLGQLVRDFPDSPQAAKAQALLGAGP